MNLVAGDTLTVSQLLYGLLIPSGNDGARALARHVGAKLSGSEDPDVATGAFVNEMNAYAASLGLKNSRFTVPDGIDTPNSYTSAYDMTILSRELMRNDFLRGVVKEPAYRFYSVGPEGRVYEKDSTNKFLMDPEFRDPSVIGVKTGTTGQAGGNVVLAREVNGGANTVLITIIGANHSYLTGDETTPDARWTDAQSIMSAMDASFTWTAPNGDGVLPGLNEQMQVWDVQFQNPPAIPVPTGADVTLGYRLQLGATTDPGARAGTLHLFYGDTEVGAVPIFQAGESALLSPQTGIAA
jgi:D-alanyl-D-alanine carboxypeptidase